MKDTKMLLRLERLIDVVFALTLWEILMLLPKPSLQEFEILSITELLVAEYPKFLIAFIGILVLSVYWIQNNRLFKYLHHTNTIHTILSILNLFLLQLFFYTVELSIHLQADSQALLAQSITALLFSLSNYAIWRYALQAKLVDNSVTVQDAIILGRQNIAEPATAIFTIPFAVFSPFLWNLSWFAYPLISKLFRGKIGNFADKHTTKHMIDSEE